MKPTPTLLLLAIAATAGVGGHTLSVLYASRGEIVPVPSYASGAILLLLAGGVLYFGLRVKRYLDESREREAQATAAPRTHHLDLTQAYRIVMFARAGAYTGAIAGGFFLGQGIYLLVRGGGTVFGALVPTLTCVLSAVALTVVGVLVQHWGKVPPGGEAEGVSESA